MHSMTESLLAWYDLHARSMPWRGIHDPYRTWVSEIMLQQTRVETVIPYYTRFLAMFPTLKDLAAAPEADVLKAWEGLGYYSRARNLHQGAKQVMADYGGKLPANPEELRRIHGIGPYTAGAIASIAYELPVPAVDGNVIRVIARLFGIREDAGAPAGRRKIEEIAADLVPDDRPGDYNQAVMDLGAMICVPGTPDCAHCPLASRCNAYSRGDAAELPILAKAKPPRMIQWTVVIVRSGDRVLIRKRTEKLLQGLWCFPMVEESPSPEELMHHIRNKWKMDVSNFKEEGEARHVFTHQVWQMRIVQMRAAAGAKAPAGCRFIAMEDTHRLPIPTAMAVPFRIATRDSE